ncbi:GNAT family N-acetyltransferase [Lysobacter solisilvae (ex Woo and Kim 2020)]|uniref:GNAT family N-acetyltransferase n=1 Tax=Agrilutibacter terrestris TaxID=2865112 RepID=A0A7H0FWB0_9GAMM|nr:GNAT family N-acetyltransferase [Lysobacter terrestris]QNP40326.1 GNAT family N-acetyltransferase [Lysobacter terrestris]
MPYVVQTEAIELAQIDLVNLHRLAASEPVDFGGVHLFEGALPPPHVVSRALAQLQLGTPALWCVPFLIISRARRAALGGCTFKTMPVDGTVEIGYGVAASERGRGVATAAIRELLQMAALSGLVQEVVAHIVPDNVASSRVVSRLGFTPGERILEPDGETVVRWSWRVAS